MEPGTPGDIYVVEGGDLSSGNPRFFYVKIEEIRGIKVRETMTLSPHGICYVRDSVDKVKEVLSMGI